MKIGVLGLFSGPYHYAATVSVRKGKPGLRERIRRILAGGRSITGRGEIQRELYPSGQWTLEDTADLNRTMNRMIQDGELIETKTDVAGAHEFPAVSEWHYKLGTPVRAEQPISYEYGDYD